VTHTDLSRLGVVIVAFNSADVILDCLESLLASRGVALSVVVVDNASTDGMPAHLRAWGAGAPWAPAGDLPLALAPSPKPRALDGAPGPGGHEITLIETGINAGFAAGVNRGLAHLMADPRLERFWILNPDSVVAPDTARAFATHPGEFALMGGRVLYLETPDQIQIDGGWVNRRSGLTGNLGLGQISAQTPAPDQSQLDFITGASMVASRRFVAAAGPMPEDYFLYYEEVDWALRRHGLPGGDLPLAYCAGALVWHRAGTAIGSPTLGRPAAPFSLYFKHRGRIRFVRRHFPASLPFALGYSLAKSVQLLLKSYPVEAWTVLSASLGLGPSRAVRARLSSEAAARAFGPPRK
jgi:GT2 family glycosyltransferase